MFIRIIKKDSKTSVAEFRVDDIDLIKDFWNDTDYQIIKEDEEE